MTLLPEDTVRAYVAAEMAAAKAWAARNGLALAYDEDTHRLKVELQGAPDPNTGLAERFVLHGSFEDYKAVPPAWWFVHPDTGADIGPPAFPLGPTPNSRGSSLFIGSGPTGAVICAHFNRLAYAEHAGPHGDWGPPTNWLTPPPSQYTYAETIADMLARIHLETRESTARMAPLP